MRFLTRNPCYKLLCKTFKIVLNSSNGICPGADALFAAANVIADPNTSPAILLTAPFPPIDIVTIG